MSVQPMPVVTFQPGPCQHHAGLKTGMWSSGVYDCCEDMHICCLGFWCPCCLACQVSSSVGESHCLPLLDGLGGTVPPIALALRSTLRERYHIQGSITHDCCIVTCCPTCSWCQMARELKARRTTLQVNVTPTAPPGTIHIAMHHSQPPYPQPPAPIAGLYPPMPK